MFGLLMSIFGLLAVLSGKIILTRRVSIVGSDARILGALLLAPIPITLIVTLMTQNIAQGIDRGSLRATGSTIALICLVAALAWGIRCVTAHTHAHDSIATDDGDSSESEEDTIRLKPS